MTGLFLPILLFVGAALAEGGTGAVLWGGMDGVHPVGVFGADDILPDDHALHLAWASSDY